MFYICPKNIILLSIGNVDTTAKPSIVTLDPTTAHELAEHPTETQGIQDKLGGNICISIYVYVYPIIEE